MLVALTDRQRGLCIACAGVLCVTPDAVLIRWAQSRDASTAAILFWKLFFVSVFTCAYVVYREAQETPLLEVPRGLCDRVATGKRLFLYGVLLQGTLDLAFSLALILIIAARVMIWYSLNVLWSALLGYALLGDVLPRRTVAACGVAVGCVLLVLAPQLGAGGADNRLNPIGDVCAVYVGVGIALFLVVTRQASRTAPKLPMALATSFGALAAVLAVWVSTAFTGETVFSGDGVFYLIMIIDGWCIAAIFVAYSIAPRYITGAECGLCSLIETVLGPLWVFLVYGERPPTFTFVGGILLITTLAAHELAAAREVIRQADAKPAADEVLAEKGERL